MSSSFRFGVGPGRARLDIESNSSAPTQAHARIIRERGIFHEVHSCFRKEEPSMREVFRMVESGTIYVVPVFISEGYFTQTVIPRELEWKVAIPPRGPDDPLLRSRGKPPSHDGSPATRAREVAPNVPPGATSLSSLDMAPTSMTIPPARRRSRRRGFKPSASTLRWSPRTWRNRL